MEASCSIFHFSLCIALAETTAVKNIVATCPVAGVTKVDAPEW